MIIKLAELVSQHILRHRMLLKSVLLFAAPLTLFHLKSDYSLRSYETLYDQIDPLYNLTSDEPVDFAERPPHQTICIVLSEKNRGSSSIIGEVRRLRLRTKSVVFTDRDIRETFFAKIFIQTSDRSSVHVHPLRNFQPNSDLLALAIKVFGCRLSLHYRDLTYGPFENAVYLSLRDTKEDRQKLLTLLRYYMNVEAFVWCNFFYVPFRKFYIRAEPLILFNIVVICTMLFDCDLLLDPLGLVFTACLFGAAPLSLVLLYDARRNAILALLFSVINFKFGFVFCLLFYVYTVVKQAACLVRKALCSSI